MNLQQFIREAPLRQLRGAGRPDAKQRGELLLSAMTEPPLDEDDFAGFAVDVIGQINLSDLRPLLTLREADGPAFAALMADLNRPHEPGHFTRRAERRWLMALQVATFVRLCAPDPARFQRLTGRMSRWPHDPLTWAGRNTDPEEVPESRLFRGAQVLLNLTGWASASSERPVQAEHWTLLMALRSLTPQTLPPQWPASPEQARAERQWWPQRREEPGASYPSNRFEQLKLARPAAWLLPTPPALARTLTGRAVQATRELTRRVQQAPLIHPNQTSELDTDWLQGLSLEGSQTLRAVFFRVQEAIFQTRLRRTAEYRTALSEEPALNRAGLELLALLRRHARHQGNETVLSAVLNAAELQRALLVREEAELTRRLAQHLSDDIYHELSEALSNTRRRRELAFRLRRDGRGGA